MSDDVHERIRAAYSGGYADGRAAADLTEQVTEQMHQQEMALRYERGHDEALDEAVEVARAVLTDHPALLHQLEQRLIGRYSPAGRAESTALEPTWAPAPPPTPASTKPAGTREESE